MKSLFRVNRLRQCPMFRIQNVLQTSPVLRCFGSMSHYKFQSFMIQQTHACRHFGVTVGNVPNKFSYSMAIESQKMILAKLSDTKYVNALTNIRNSPGNIIMKWQGLLGLTMPLQLEVLNALSSDGEILFPANSEGLALYQHNLMHHQRNDKTGQLNRAIKAIWTYLFKLAFGATDNELRLAPKMTLESARKLAVTVSHATIVESFLQQIDKALETIQKEGKTEQELLIAKRMKVLDTLLPLHTKILTDQGFRGDVGYVLSQKGLMDFSDDPVIMSAVNESTVKLYQRAGLM